ncbi:MAG TPA: hypothetical protein PLL50_05800 [Propionicimonas sp.]|mgnify:CR=1 FL=1|nr:hypothetical protein [Propionicimonas sp.]HQA77853.1 hypothetical protein [Propionicimonas sp.]HQD96885.1 hypothetical protein [Propionicimonas sp.]
MLKHPRRWVRRVLGRSKTDAQPAVLRLEFSTPEQFAAFVSDPRARRKYRALELRVSPWYAIRPDWTGRLGPLKGVRSLRTDFDQAGRVASAGLVLAEPIAGYELVRAAFGLFYPVRPTTGWGGRRVAVDAGAPVADCWQPGGGLRPLNPRKQKKQFTDFEVLVDGEGEFWLGEHPAPPVLIERTPGSQILIDPKVHRPLERRQPSPSTVSATARVRDGRLLIDSNGSLLVDADASAGLTATNLRQLGLVTDIDASGVGGGLVAGRLVAQLAAYGAVVHDAAPGLELSPELARLVESPFARMGLLDHMNRSLAQVRAVMTGHTRAFTEGELPSVSVILSCQRPNLLVRILEQLAAQDHPNVEVVVGCHGFPAPARESFPEPVLGVLGPVLEFGSDMLFGDVLAGLSAAASGDFITKVDDDDWYGPHHLTDLLAAWTYSEAHLVGKKLALVHFEEDDSLVIRRFFLEGYRWQVAGGAAIIAKHDLTAVGGWRSQRRAVDRGLWTRMEEAGALTYACSGPGYVHTRHAGPHTWAVNDQHFRESYAEETLTGIPPAALGVR